MDLDRFRYVVHAMLTQVGEGERQFPPDLVVHAAAYADRTGLGELLDSCRDVDAIAVDCLVLGDHVAEIDPDPELHAAFGGKLGIGGGKLVLDLDRAFHGRECTGEFDQQAVARRANNAAAAGRDRRFHDPSPDLPEAGKGVHLIRGHKPGITGRVCGHDGD
jgi:hypothetical protein